MILPNKYKKDIVNLDLAFNSLNMKSASTKLCAFYQGDIRKFSRLEGPHNNHEIWGSVIEESLKEPPSIIGTATESYLEPASQRIDDAPDVDNMPTDGLMQAAKEVEEAGMDMTRVTEACLLYMKNDIQIVKTSGLNTSSANTSWERTVEIAALSILEEYKRVNPNSITSEEIKLASVNAGKFYSQNGLYKTASWWTAPFRWAGGIAKTIGKFLGRSIAKLLPWVGVVASVYFAFDAWKKWRQEINFIFADLNAGNYGIDNWDTWFVSRLSGKLKAAIEENENIPLSDNDKPHCSSESGSKQCFWYFTPEKPEEALTRSNFFPTLWSDMKGAFSEKEDEKPMIEEGTGEKRIFGDMTGDPNTDKELAALNVSCGAIMENAYLLIENILTGIVSLWAAIGEVAGLVTFGLASGAIAAIDAVVSAALMIGSWAKRRELRRDFSQNRSNVIRRAAENLKRIEWLEWSDSLQEREERMEARESEETEPQSQEPSVAERTLEEVSDVAETVAPKVNLIPTLTRGVSTVLKAADYKP